MKYKFKKADKPRENFLIYLEHSNDCKASRASTELMLDRFFNGKESYFPF